MNCAKCGTEMEGADLLTGMSRSMILGTKKKSMWDSETMCVVNCYVCPQCGAIELRASKPELFKTV
ncbi:MAG: hypothetical protein HFF23_02560 [Oscillospiraceae bacterium]|nr:hypothetical protein [Oscillospiraceae bacterium]